MADHEMENNKRLGQLLAAYKAHRITESELEELHELSMSEGAEGEFNTVLQQDWNSFSVDNELTVNSDLYQNIINDQRFKASVEPRSFRLQKLLPYAAAAILLLVAGIFFFQIQHLNTAMHSQQAQQVRISPGGKKAILTLGDGSAITLDSSKTSLGILQDEQITYTAGSIAYQQESSQTQLEYNTIRTPKGGEYQVTLQDGTKVWLNAASSIRYPVVFNGNERRVYVSGEAYFEVAKNKEKPFIVTAKHTEVKVLGTHFNVSAYEEDQQVSTTLVEGAVKVSSGEYFALLRPDQQAIVPQGSRQITVSNVHAEEALAWKNGIFLYNNENIREVMKVIARWYDIEVIYQGDLSNKTFGGTISRFEDFEKLLKTLELTGAIHFKIEGRRVTVMP